MGKQKSSRCINHLLATLHCHCLMIWCPLTPTIKTKGYHRKREWDGFWESNVFQKLNNSMTFFLFFSILVSINIFWLVNFNSCWSFFISDCISRFFFLKFRRTRPLWEERFYQSHLINFHPFNILLNGEQ